MNPALGLEWVPRSEMSQSSAITTNVSEPPYGSVTSQFAPGPLIIDRFYVLLS